MSIFFTYESKKKSNVGQVLSKAQISQKIHFNLIFLHFNKTHGFCHTHKFYVH